MAFTKPARHIHSGNTLAVGNIAVAVGTTDIDFDGQGSNLPHPTATWVPAAASAITIVHKDPWGNICIYVFPATTPQIFPVRLHTVLATGTDNTGQAGTTTAGAILNLLY